MADKHSNEMNIETFSLKSRDEVVRFEELLDSYMSARAQGPINHISLVNAYDALQSRPDGGRVFSAIVDVQMSFLLIFLDMHSSGATWNSHFSKGKHEGGSVLDSQAKFFGKMDIHRSYTAYVLRYRALWDKLMGVIVLLHAPDRYDSFAKAKSRKGTFSKIAREKGFADEETIKSLADLLTDFDDKFRTPEAHGTGALRKYSFTMTPMNENPTIELVGFWNVANSFVTDLGKNFPSVAVLADAGDA